MNTFLGMTRLIAAAIGPVLALHCLVGAAAPAAAEEAPGTPKLVISELYIVDNAAQPAYNQSFVELRNDSTSVVDLAAWKLTFRTGTATIGGVGCALAGSVQPGGYAVVALGTVGSVGSGFDSVGSCPTVRPYASFGQLYIAPSSIASVVPGTTGSDMVGWGPSAPHEGANPATGLSGGEALIREPGSPDTDDNATDFRRSTLATPGRVLPTSEFERWRSASFELSGIVGAKDFVTLGLWVLIPDEDQMTVTPYRLNDGTAGSPAELDGMPTGLAYDAARKRVYVSATYGSLNVIDADPASASFGTVLARVEVGALAQDVALTPDGSRVLVATYTDSPVLLAIDANAITRSLDPADNAGAVIGGWALDEEAGQLAVGTAGGSVVAAITGASTLSIVDVGSLRAGEYGAVNAKVSVPAQAAGVAIGNDTAYVVSNNGTPATAFRGALTAVDLVGSGHPATSVLAGANSDAVLFDDGDLYVLNGHVEGSLSIFDPQTLVERGAVKVAATPTAMTVEGDTIVVAHDGSPVLTSVSRERRAVGQPTGSTPGQGTGQATGQATGQGTGQAATGQPSQSTSGPASAALVSKSKAKVKLAKLKSRIPVLTGRARVGFRIGVKTTGWGPRGVKLRYQWYANGKRIKGATKKSIKVTPALRHKVVWVVVTGHRAGYKTLSRASYRSPRIRG